MNSRYRLLLNCQGSKTNHVFFALCTGCPAMKQFAILYEGRIPLGGSAQTHLRNPGRLLKRKTKTGSTNPHELNTKFVRYFVKFRGSCYRRCFQNFQKTRRVLQTVSFQQPALEVFCQRCRSRGPSFDSLLEASN